MDHQTIQLLDFLSVIQVTIQLTDHFAIGLLMDIWLSDLSDNRMPTVVSFWICACPPAIQIQPKLVIADGLFTR